MSRDNEVSVNIRADLKKLRRDLAEAKREVKKIPEQLDIRTNLIATGLKSKLNEIKQALKPLENIQMKVDTSALDVASRKAQKAARDINAALGASTKAARGAGLGLGSGRAVVTGGGSLAGMGTIDRAVVGGAMLGVTAGRGAGVTKGGPVNMGGPGRIPPSHGLGLAGGRAVVTGGGPVSFASGAQIVAGGGLGLAGGRPIVTSGGAPNLGGGTAGHQAVATSGSRAVIGAAYEQKRRAAARKGIDMVDIDAKDLQKNRQQRQQAVRKQNAAQSRLTGAINSVADDVMVSRRGMTPKVMQGGGYQASNAKANATLAAMASNRTFHARNMSGSIMPWNSNQSLHLNPGAAFSGYDPGSRAAQIAMGRRMIRNRNQGGGFTGRVPGFGFGGGGGGGGGGRRPWRFMGGGGGGGIGRSGFGGAANFASGAIARGLYRSGAAGAIVGGAGALAVPAGVGAVAGKVLSDGVRRQASIEQTETSLRVLLKDGGAAKELVSELRKMEAQTPVELTTLATNSQKLAASGFEAEKIPALLGTIMDAASVGVDTFENNAFRLTKALSQIKTNGRLLGEELLQLTDIGLPINEIIKEKFGMNSQELAKASQAGEVEIGVILDAITSGLKEKFGGALEEQTNTLTGQLNMLKKSYMVLAEELADPVFDALSDFVGDLNEQIKSGEGGWATFIDGLKNTLYLVEKTGAIMNQVGGSAGGGGGITGAIANMAQYTSPAAWIAANARDAYLGGGVTDERKQSNFDRNKEQRNESLRTAIANVRRGYERIDPSNMTPEAMRGVDVRNRVRDIKEEKLLLENNAAELQAEIALGGNKPTSKQIKQAKANSTAMADVKQRLEVAQLAVPSGNPVKDLVNQGKIGDITGNKTQGYAEAGKAFAKEYMAASGERTKRIGEGQTSSDSDAALDKIRSQFNNLELGSAAEGIFMKAMTKATGLTGDTLRRDISGSDADRRMAAQRLENSMVGPTATAAQMRKAQQDTAIRERGEKFQRNFGVMDKRGMLDKGFRQGLLNQGLTADQIDKFLEDNDVTARGKIDGRLQKGGVLQFDTKAKMKADLGNAERTGFGDLQSLIQSKLDQSYERETAENTARVAKAVEAMNDKLDTPQGDKEVTAKVGP